MKRRCKRCLALLARGFERQELSARHYDFVWRELESCDSCRAAYDELVLAERLLVSGGKSTSEPSPMELRMVRARVLASPKPERASVWSWGAWSLLPALALGLVLLVWRGPAEVTPEFSARGGTSHAAISVFCQSATDVRLLSASDELATCSRQSVLAFAYTTDVLGLVSVHWRSKDASGWVGKNQRLARSSALTPLDLELTLATLAGDVTLTLLTHEATLSDEELGASLNGAREGVRSRVQQVRLSQ